MKKTHVYEVDFMRTFIMLGVLSVHTMTIFNQQFDDWTIPFLSMSAFHSSMKVTRLAFMFITGFVLFLTYYHKELQLFTFWKKRLSLIAIPYVFWNIVYLLFRGTYSIDFDGSISAFLVELMNSLLQGDEFYIYFVLVSFQFYLVFPFLLALLKRYEKWHLQLFVGSVIFQVLLTTFYKLGIPHLDTSDWPYLLSHYGVFVFSYQCWFVAGGMVACHYEKICAFLEQHKKTILFLLVAGVVIMWVYYYFNRFILLESDKRAQSPQQPIFLPYSFLVIAILLIYGRKWASVRNEPKWEKFTQFIMFASSCSFGMFLVQPFPLFMVKQMVPLFSEAKWMYVFVLPSSIVFVYATSMILSYMLNKTPIVSYVVGKKSKLPRGPKMVKAREQL
ncbi:acyltransferase [Bacillus coreaensis]